MLMAERYFLVSVQPCFDKKLEASRLDFLHEEEGDTMMEVDLVLSTSEVWNMLKKLASESLPSTTGRNGSKK